MLELRLRPNARRDVAGIWKYTHRHWSRAQADRYVSAIRAEIERLREKPSLGRPVKNAQAPFLKRKSGSHVIFYLVADGILDVVRVLHENMDFTIHLANDQS
jgi:toxin ParE1/3/4